MTTVNTIFGGLTTLLFDSTISARRVFFMMTQDEIRSKFRIRKQLENRGKELTYSPDFLTTSDYLFSAICPNQYEGDSGSLLLAQPRNQAADALLIKHARLHAAANEFVYSKLAEAMGYAVPKAALFHVMPDDRAIFATDFVVGAPYFIHAQSNPTFTQIREQADNWQEYFCLRALSCMFLDADGCEFLLSNSGHLYRVDTADSFLVNEAQILAAADIPFFRGMDCQHFIEHRLLADLRAFWDYSFFDEELLKCTQWDNTAIKFYLQPFEQIQSIPQTYIDSFLQILCCLYPDLLGDYYKKLILTLQSVSRDYLKTRG